MVAPTSKKKFLYHSAFSNKNNYRHGTRVLLQEFDFINVEETGIVKFKKRELVNQKNHQLIDLIGQAHLAAEKRSQKGGEVYGKLLLLCVPIQESADDTAVAVDQ